jgi:cysteinyl-tRNA synthetase
MAEWQAIMFGVRGSYLDRIIRAGFDGVWIDRVDIHRYWVHARPTAFAEMVEFIDRLSRWAKAERPGFLVVPQNGEDLLADPIYRAAIDGLGKEDLLFGDHGNDKPNAEWRIERALSFIGPARTGGLPVFAVEYLRSKDNQAAADRRLRELGLLPYFGPRSLAYLGTDGPRHAEDKDSEPLMEEVGPEGC